MQTVLTIAGFDPSSGAGITADLFVFAAHGLFGTSCITSLTVQSTLGVRSSNRIDPRIVTDTLACLSEDLPPAGLKIGMLATAEIVAAVSAFLEEQRDRGLTGPIVLDPVLRSSSGRELLEPKGLDLLQSRILPLVDWITPNLDELSILTGQVVTNRDQMISAANALHQACRHTINIFATGGHLEPPDDLLVTRQGTQHWLRGDHVATSSTHGTGCALSSALLSRLVLGDDPLTAPLAAKRYVNRALRSAVPIGHGKGPMNHLWPLQRGRIQGE